MHHQYSFGAHLVRELLELRVRLVVPSRSNSLREEARTREELRITAFPDLGCGGAVAVRGEGFRDALRAEGVGGVEEALGVDVVFYVG